MSRSETSPVRTWFLIFAVFAGLVWLLRGVLLPFVAGMVLAYFLAPVVNKLERRRIPRWLGSLAVLLGFGIIAGTIITLVFPLIAAQATALFNSIPGYVAKFHDHFLPWAENALTQFQPADVEKLRDAAGQSAGEVATWVGGVLKNIVTGGFAVIDALALAIITPVTAFFTLRDWTKLTRTIDSVFPRRYYDVIHGQLSEVDTTLSGFIRGQALVCLALGLYYSIGLSVVGLNYGATIGIVAGVLSFIPFVGTIFGWATSLMLAFAQFDDLTHIGLVVGVFLFGHVLESYVLTPRLVGDRVGLHSLWVLFALIAGGKLLGFMGVLIAVPTAAVIGVLVRFMIKRYKSSSLYKDAL